jgi:hypothetical protein
MTANEMRIGNLIYGGTIVKVLSIDNEGCFVEPLIGEYESEIMHPNLKPIPLTEEWLLKFGFEKEYFYGDDAKFIWWQLNDFGLEIFNTNKEQGRTSIESKDVGFFYEPMFMDYIEIKHVHQLQNLYFALTGEELTLKEI